MRFWILATLLAANLVVGVLSLYFVRSVNRQYATLFEHGAPVIYELRTLTREATAVQRLARRIVTPEHEPAWAGLFPEIGAARERFAARLEKVGGMDLFRGTPHPAALAAVSTEYQDHVQAFLRLAQAGHLAAAADFNLTVVRPAHDRVQQALDDAADHVELQGRGLRERYAKDSRFFGGLSLAFASIPVVALSSGILLMTVLIAVLLLVVINPRPDRR